MGYAWELFEGLDEIVFAADMETYELAYLNKKAREAFGFASLEEACGNGGKSGKSGKIRKKCYQLFQRSDAPCAFCRGSGGQPGGFEQRRCFSPRLNRYFLLRDALWREDGKAYRLEMAMDISAQERQDSLARSVRNLEAVINKGLRAALREETPDRSLEVLLEYLGKALDGERTYIFERNDSCRDDNTYEWTAPGVRPERENLQNLPPEVCANWYRDFGAGRRVVIRDLEDIRQSDPLQYENLKGQSIRSLVAVPLYDDGQIIGFFGVDNPPVKSLEYTPDMLQITAHFIVSSLRRRNLVRELQKRSYDVLYALNVDYLGIYQVNFDTGECVAYREKEWLRGHRAVRFEDGYQAAMERYISLYAAPQDQETLRAVTRKEYVLKRLAESRKFYVRYQARKNPQGIRHLELHFSVTGKELEKNRVIFAFRDVNAVVEQEERYKQETQRKLEDILEGSRTGIWTIELEEGRQPRLYADRTMRALLGVDGEAGPEACYQSWVRNIDAGYADSVQEAVREMAESGRSEVVYPWNHPVQGKIYVRCGGVRNLKFKKPGICLNGYHQDITETMVTRKKQEQAIMELLEKVRRANSAKSEFLSHMSHDLRTPINGILGMLSILEAFPDDPEKQRDCREKIRIATEHLLSLVNDVLQVSKLESGRAAVVEEPFDLYRALEDCIAVLSPQAGEAGVNLVLEEADLEHSGLLGNPMHLKQILMNLLDNAIKFNRPGGFVYVQVRETACENGTAHFQFVVEDTGIGIGEAFKPRIFEAFSQENQGARTHYNGVGLGMAIVKKLVDQMQGGITVESQTGQGSLFQVTLPFRVDEKRAPPGGGERRDRQAGLSGMRVLLAEDNEINREIMRFLLEQAGAEVAEAEDGKAAADAFTASAPGDFDCVLMDLMMPVMSGFEAARAIRGLDRPDAGTVPIIALSANAFEEDIAMAKESGMNEHLAKPVDIGRLIKAVRRLRYRRELPGAGSH